MAETEYRSVWKHLIGIPFKQDYVVANGLKTRYIQAGDSTAPVVLMLHGTGGSVECFAPTIASHSHHFNCIALDAIGCGFTDKPDIDYEIPVHVEHILGFMKSMNIATASFIGVSLGAWSSSRLAIDYPDRVRSLTILSATGLIANKQTMTDSRAARNEAIDDPSWENIKKVMARLILDESNQTPDIIAVRQLIYRKPEMRQSMQHILSLMQPSIRPRNLISEDNWKKLNAPTQIFAAPDDDADFYTTALRISELIPNAETVEIRGVKHWAQWERPDFFNEYNLDFLKRVNALN